MALEIAEKNHESGDLILIGVKGNGLPIAEKIAEYLKPYFQGQITVLELEINKKSPDTACLPANADLAGKHCILIDDVANSGKTLFHAMKPILAQGPEQLETLLLIERTHKKFPIAINYVGISVATTLEEHIEVGVEGKEVSGAWMR